MVRYELEKALIHGELAVADLPAAWNANTRSIWGWMCPTTPTASSRTSTGPRAASATSPATPWAALTAPQAHGRPEKAIDFEAMYAAGDLAPLRDELTRRLSAVRQPERDRLAGGKPLRRPLRPQLLRGLPDPEVHRTVQPVTRPGRAASFGSAALFVCSMAPCQKQRPPAAEGNAAMGGLFTWLAGVKSWKQSALPQGRGGRGCSGSGKPRAPIPAAALQFGHGARPDLTNDPLKQPATWRCNFVHPFQLL